MTDALPKNRRKTLRENLLPRSSPADAYLVLSQIPNFGQQLFLGRRFRLLGLLFGLDPSGFFFSGFLPGLKLSATGVNQLHEKEDREGDEEEVDQSSG